MPHTYTLECADGTLYAGSTWNLDRRLWEHETGQGSAYTRRRLPVRLVWSGEYERIADAYDLEKRIQGWSHAKRLAFIEVGIAAIVGWSGRRRHEAAARYSSAVERARAARLLPRSLSEPARSASE